ncbi:hypothetical protein [Pedobacter sp. Hv1]|uniref:hypothetical protein n=1 Tax=Pedobacter sp. Hv1 TaxID=1740090 RepID=UPI0006D8C970|nr:hypothetical protein [Pedobacter sp. Hv1]KQC01040.1 hypothetical protein AQF98_10250 [Pedobacter sp. Hv1]
MKYVSLCLLLFFFSTADAQQLKLKTRKKNALTGSEFAKSIADSSLTLQQREILIFKEIKSGNIPDFLRILQEVRDTIQLNPKQFATIKYDVLPDYLAIGNNDDYIYIPMTPILAQRIAYLLKCSLPTKKMVDRIYKSANIKLEPQPMPPTKAMTTVPVFVAHNELVKLQLKSYPKGKLTAGNQKDVIISNKIYGEQTPRVVIYGWHKLDGKAIQPVYNKHTNTWADYSHGIRLIQNKVWVNGKKTTVQKVLAEPNLNPLLSDEGRIEKAYYPIFKSY